MTLSPAFLTLQEVLRLHRDQIERYGGRHGVRDLGLLQSAIGVPSAGHAGGYLLSDIYEMAAAYLFHIARNHPFVDGNKRTGLASALLFLFVNDIVVIAPPDETERLVLAVAEGDADRTRIAQFLRRYTRLKA